MSLRTIVVDFFLNSWWRESAKPLLFFCNTMPASLLVDQRKILFFHKKQSPVAILFWLPWINYITTIFRNWHPLTRYPVWMQATPTLKRLFGVIFGSSFTLYFFSLISSSVFTFYICFLLYWLILYVMYCFCISCICVLLCCRFGVINNNNNNNNNAFLL